MKLFGAALAPALALLAGSAVSAATGNRCTRETLTVREVPTTATYCVAEGGLSAAGHELPVHVIETYSTPRGSFTQAAVLRFIAGEDPSRVIADVPLERAGLQGTLHVTLVLRRGLVHIEGAMLTPGAILVK